MDEFRLGFISTVAADVLALHAVRFDKELVTISAKRSDSLGNADCFFFGFLTGQPEKTLTESVVAHDCTVFLLSNRP